jgi:hypothetical protein
MRQDWYLESPTEVAHYQAIWRDVSDRSDPLDTFI